MAFNSSKISALQGSTGATGADGADGVDGIAGDGTGDVITVGTPADSYIGVWTADNSMEGTSSLVFDSTGLGIGTSSPSTILHCASSAARIICQSTGNSNSTIDIRADGTGDSQIWFDLAGTSPFAIGVDNSDGDKFKISGGSPLGTNDRLAITSGGDCQWYNTAAAVKMTWDASESRLGIGTEIPAKKLEVSDSSSGESIPIVLSNRDTTAGTGQKVTLGLGLARNSGAFKPEAGTIEVGREQDWTSADNNIDSYMAFSVYENNAAIERLRITSAGLVGIGLSPSTEVLETAGNISFYNTSGANPNTLKSQGATDASISGHFHTAFGCWVRNENSTRAAGMDGTSSGGELMLYSNSVERLRITSGGDCQWYNTSAAVKMTWDASAEMLGIGVLPSAALHVKGTETRLEGNGHYISFFNASGTRRGYIQADEGSAFRIYNEQAVPTIFTTGGTVERMRISATGLVGIGGVPSTQLHVFSTSTQPATFESTSGSNRSVIELLPASGGNAFLISEGGYLSIGGASSLSTSNLNIDTVGGGAGNVGIGVVAPTHRLHNAGTSRFDERVTVKKASNSEFATTIVTSGDDIEIDLDDADNFNVTISGTADLPNPSNITVGQSGCIVIEQDGGLSDISTWGTYWHFEDATPPTLSEDDGAIDNLVYFVASATSIHAILLKKMG